MRAADVSRVGELWRVYSARFTAARVLSDAELAHALLPRAGVVWTYLAADESAFVCFYAGAGAHLSYYAHADAALVAAAARAAGFDALTCATVMDNCTLLADLRPAGPGVLRWYLDNYRAHPLAGMHATADATAGRGLGLVMI